MSTDNSFRRLIEKVAAEAEVFQIKLPVAESSLSPVFSKEAISLHYGTLYKNYVKKALAGEGEFQVAGAKLHTLFFEQVQTPKSNNKPTDASQLFIDKHFGSYTAFQKELVSKALEIHGSGWIYLASNGSLKTIANHKVVSDVILLIDMWEHSYILDYGSDKEKYLSKIWSIINWDIINARLN